MGKDDLRYKLEMNSRENMRKEKEKTIEKRICLIMYVTHKVIRLSIFYSSSDSICPHWSFVSSAFPQVFYQHPRYVTVVLLWRH